ncbi:hypothetical protein [Oleiagrimonas sp. C23AA]|uniref:hypothetical protein n=1 Tax=Oleiagrimonas sp. C23AA TaxID=2719047 RepID=UPI00141FBD6C|nr:hypothetical protein [Oleiagrimonas sp. C23AA]NII11736.1 hypothetical protein [Oleiagrimonas sp. C23AA]
MRRFTEQTARRRQRYLRAVKEPSGCRLALIATGADRSNSTVLDDPFAWAGQYCDTKKPRFGGAFCHSIFLYA